MSSLSLAEVWPDTEAGLRRSCYFWGVHGELVDEVVQEVAERAVRRTVQRGPFPSAGDLARWARHVAHNVLVGHYRRRLPDLLGGLDDVLVDDVDVGLEVEAKLWLEAVRQNLASLDARDQHAITRRLNGIRSSSRREGNYWVVRYRRARARLEELMEGAAVGVLVRSHRWRARLEGVAVTAAAAVVTVAAPAVPVVVDGIVVEAAAAIAPHGATADRNPPAPIPAPESSESGVDPPPSTIPAPRQDSPLRPGPRPRTTPQLDVAVAGPDDRPAAEAVVEQGGRDEHLACVLNPTPPWSPVPAGTVCAGRPLRPLAPAPQP